MVCLNGIVPDIRGVFFDNKAAPRESVTSKNVEVYKRENELAIVVAMLGHASTATDFTNPADLKIAQEVFKAKPRIVSICSIRVILLYSGLVEFNTLYLL